MRFRKLALKIQNATLCAVENAAKEVATLLTASIINLRKARIRIAQNIPSAPPILSGQARRIA